MSRPDYDDTSPLDDDDDGLRQSSLDPIAHPEAANPPHNVWAEFGRQLAEAVIPRREPRRVDFALVPAPMPLGADALAAVRDALGAVDDALEEDELYLATDGMQIRMRYPWLSRTLEDRGVDLEAFERRLGDLGAL